MSKGNHSNPPLHHGKGQGDGSRSGAHRKGKSRLRYFNKRPPFHPDPEHWTRKQHSWKAKVAYDTDDAAYEFLHQHPKLKAEGFVVYQCKVCQKWHVGHLKHL